jgi:hypothetical protein
MVQAAISRRQCPLMKMVLYMKNGWNYVMVAFVAQSSKRSNVRMELSATKSIKVTFIRLFRDNGVKAIENLMEKRGKFDYVLLETR